MPSDADDAEDGWRGFEPDSRRHRVHLRAMVEQGSRGTSHQPSAPFRTEGKGTQLLAHHPANHRGEDTASATAEGRALRGPDRCRQFIFQASVGR